MPETAAPAPAPEAQPETYDSVRAEIAANNEAADAAYEAQLQQQIGQPEPEPAPAPVIEPPAPSPESAPVAEAAPEPAQAPAPPPNDQGGPGERKEAEAPVGASALAPAEAAPSDIAGQSFAFTPDLGLDAFQEAKNSYLETVEVTPEITQIFDYYENALANASIPETAFEDFGGQERVSKTIGAFDRLFKTKVVETPNGPIAKADTSEAIELLRKDYQNEFFDLVADVMASDGLRWPGLTMLQEFLIREFGVGPDQVEQIQNFLTHRTPLPQAQNLSQMPAGIDESVKDAFFNQTDSKRFELESLAKEIAQVETDLPALDEYYKAEANKKLADLREKMAGELQLLRDAQAGIESRRTQVEIVQRQNAQAAAVFNEELLREHYTEEFALADAYAEQIAGKLTFLDESMRPAQARSILARITNACSFMFDPSTYAYVEDPTAAHYAKQFTEEGIKFDFAKGSRLLHEHLLTKRHIKVLKHTGGSPQAIASAERDKNKVLKEIKAAQAELLGQITARFIASASNQLNTNVEEAAAKKQAVRPVVAPTGADRGPRRETLESVRAEIAANNARVDAERAASGLEGDDDYLANVVFGRREAGAI